MSVQTEIGKFLCIRIIWLFYRAYNKSGLIRNATSSLSQTVQHLAPLQSSLHSSGASDSTQHLQYISSRIRLIFLNEKWTDCRCGAGISGIQYRDCSRGVGVVKVCLQRRESALRVLERRICWPGRRRPGSHPKQNCSGTAETTGEAFPLKQLQRPKGCMHACVAVAPHVGLGKN